MTTETPKAIAIGASAGAIEALFQVLPVLPKFFRLPIFVVVHIPSNRPSLLPEIFQPKCQMSVVEAEDKEPILGGTIYFAPPNYHLLVESETSLSLSSDEVVLHSRPSINVLFETAADVYGANLTAIVLTGSNRDGADGLRAVVAAGGSALVQRPKEATASAMPEAALARCPNARELSLFQIATHLQGL